MTEKKIHLGTVGHFGLAVRDPKKSAAWWSGLFDLETLFEGYDYVGVSSSDVTIVFSQGTPHPGTLGHMSFHLPNMTALRDALDALKAAGVKVEDLGDEIGPEAPGSPNMGLWFHDPDGYRWELSVQAKG
jgi:catechol 2,3-dioxygenase-like lactoylglutathione lyase family enzyme